MSNDDSCVEVANVDEIPSGKMKHVEFNGKEIMITNLYGKLYAFNDRCNHTNAPLSMGNIQGTIVTCPMHGARFEITKGRCQIRSEIPVF
jgi:nitrite reductase/ring-hydroxylating ferredoxin subunit